MKNLIAVLIILTMAACASTTATTPVATAQPAKPPVVSTLPAPSVTTAPAQRQTWTATNTPAQILAANHRSGGLMTADDVRTDAASALLMAQQGKAMPKNSPLLLFNAGAVKNAMDVQAYQLFYGLPVSPVPENAIPPGCGTQSGTGLVVCP